MKRYIDDNGHFYNGRTVTIGDRLIINPTEEQIIEAGYHEYVEPEPTEEEILINAKMDLANSISEYDNSTNVNEFMFNGMPMWLTKGERESLDMSIRMFKGQEEQFFPFFINNQSYMLPIAVMETMLSRVEVYATRCMIVTKQHEAAAQSLATLEEVKNYDYTANYPNKLSMFVDPETGELSITEIDRTQEPENNEEPENEEVEPTEE